jgi:allantoicase
MLVSRAKLSAHAIHSFNVSAHSMVSKVRITIFPDGGVSRLRVYGHI